MKKEITTQDLISRLPKGEADALRQEIKEEVEKIKWGGKRQGAGRKPKTGNVLPFRVRVSEKEKEFLEYARGHNINYDDLMQG